MIVNLRELGGYRGREGKKIKDGLLFRSGHLSIPEEDLSGYLEPLALSVVFDLRSIDEAQHEPYTLPDGIEYRHRPVVTSMEEEMRALNMAFPFPDQNGEAGEIDVDSVSPEALSSLASFLPRFYSDMGENPKVFGGVIKEMLENGEKPILFHCSAGKDRAGIMAAMLLLSLGVAEEDVRENYLLSNHYRKEAIDRDYQHLTRKIKDSKIAGMLRNMLIVKEEYLDATLSHLRAYPRFDDYARERLDLDSHDLTALRQRYLE